MGVRAEDAAGAAGFREFLRLPERLYRDDPNWSPPLWADERKTFTTKNPILAHSEYRLLLARRDGRPAGRVLAYVDRNFNAFNRSSTGFFGSFESEDEETAGALLAEAEGWLASRGMNVVRGPINPVSECWGFLLRGHGRPATFMSPYNPPRYNDYALGRGFAKVKDLLVYEADALEGYRIPPRFLEFRRRLLERRPGPRGPPPGLEEDREEAEAIWRITNQAVSGNWGYVPLDREELADVLRQLKPIADPDAVWMVEDSGQAVGYALGIPGPQHPAAPHPRPPSALRLPDPAFRGPPAAGLPPVRAGGPARLPRPGAGRAAVREPVRGPAAAGGAPGGQLHPGGQRPHPQCPGEARADPDQGLPGVRKEAVIVKIIGISGGSGSGKTTIVRADRGDRAGVRVLAQDNYYKSAEHITNLTSRASTSTTPTPSTATCSASTSRR